MKKFKAQRLWVFLLAAIIVTGFTTFALAGQPARLGYFIAPKDGTYKFSFVKRDELGGYQDLWLGDGLELKAGETAELDVSSVASNYLRVHFNNDDLKDYYSVEIFDKPPHVISCTLPIATVDLSECSLFVSNDDYTNAFSACDSIYLNGKQIVTVIDSNLNKAFSVFVAYNLNRQIPSENYHLYFDVDDERKLGEYEVDCVLTVLDGSLKKEYATVKIVETTWADYVSAKTAPEIPEPTETPKPAEPPVFADPPSDWATEIVGSAIAAGLVPENLQKNFTEPVSRIEVTGMFIKLIELRSGLDIQSFMAGKGVSINTNAFSDTTDKAVLAANALGVINGVGDGIFDPHGTLTRAQAAVIINRISREFGVNTEGYPHNFTDVKDHWSDSELGWPAYAGIIEGVGNNMFDPEGKLTTEQAIAIAYRALLF